MTRTIAIVTPILDDWVSFAVLVEEISCLFTGSDFTFHICAVDDGSIIPFDPNAVALPEPSCILSIEVIRLAANLGHQRAIAVGLCANAESTAIDSVLVMDGDGQDRPVDIALLLATSFRHPQHIVLAQRAKRSESFVFRLWYGLYRLLFYALTGQPINFGNFSLIPMAAVRRLAHMPAQPSGLDHALAARLYYGADSA
jgi:hypothetical protein